jgi:hypothetical protein
VVVSVISLFDASLINLFEVPFKAKWIGWVEAGGGWVERRLNPRSSQVASFPVK